MPEDKVKNLQDRLYTIAKMDTTRKFHALRDKIYRKDVLERAWKEVEENKGAPGPDGTTIGKIKENGADKLLNELETELKSGTYKPGPVLRVYIPKASGGMRPLGIPNIRDRVVQAAVKIVVEPIFEADFQPFSFGYRPGTNAIDASLKIRTYLNCGYNVIIDADIEHCFDEIPHDKLIKEVSRRISDGYILKLISMWLKSPVLIEGTLCKVNKGTPQGGVISPLLANIYLNQLDTEWVRLKMGRWEGPDAQLIRYADDILVLTRKSVDMPMKILKANIERLELKLSEKKTRIVQAEDGFDFLGFRFKRRYSKRHGKKKTYFFPSPKSIKRIKEKIRDRAGNDKKHIPPEDVAKSLNVIVDGWRNYFRHSNASKSFREVKLYLVTRFRKYLGRRKGQSRPEAYKRSSDAILEERYGLIVNYKDKIRYLSTDMA